MRLEAKKKNCYSGALIAPESSGARFFFGGGSNCCYFMVSLLVFAETAASGLQVSDPSRSQVPVEMRCGAAAVLHVSLQAPHISLL